MAIFQQTIKNQIQCLPVFVLFTVWQNSRINDLTRKTSLGLFQIKRCNRLISHDHDLVSADPWSQVIRAQQTLSNENRVAALTQINFELFEYLVHADDLPYAFAFCVSGFSG